MEFRVPETFRAGVLMKAHDMQVLTLPLPKMGDDEVVMKQEACNICTSEYQHWAGLREHQPYPMAGGHEGAGIVIAKGDKVGDWLQIGDRVGVADNYCGYCKACRLGHQPECENVKTIYKTELGHWGTYGYADYFVRPARRLIKMSNDLDPAEAGFLEPVSTVVNGLRRLRLERSETVAVIGAGTLGLVNAQVARCWGARVIVSVGSRKSNASEIAANRFKAIKEMDLEAVDSSKEDPVEKIKALTDGRGVDAVILAVSTSKAYDQAFEMLKKPYGRMLLFAAGYPTTEVRIDANMFHYKKLELIGSYGAEQSDFFDAADLLNQKLINVKPLTRYGGKYSLSEIQKAFEVATVPGSFRVTVDLD